MGRSFPPRGLIADLITPLRSDGSIDDTGLARQVERLLPWVQGLLLAGPYGGEGRTLLPSQKRALLDLASRMVASRVPLLMWITEGSKEATEKNLGALNEVIERRRYQGPFFWVDTPLYYHSNRGLPELYASLCARSKRPLILFNDPGLVGRRGRPLKRRNLRTAVFKELSRIKGIVGMIFLGSVQRSHHYARAGRDAGSFRLYDGDEANFLKYPSSSGVVSVGSNLVPKAWHRVTAASLHLSRDQEAYPDQAQQIWRLGTYLRELRELYQGVPSTLIKEVLFAVGVMQGSMSPPFERSIEGRKQAILELMSRHGDGPALPREGNSRGSERG